MLKLKEQNPEARRKATEKANGYTEILHKAEIQTKKRFEDLTTNLDSVLRSYIPAEGKKLGLPIEKLYDLYEVPVQKLTNLSESLKQIPLDYITFSNGVQFQSEQYVKDHSFITLTKEQAIVKRELQTVKQAIEQAQKRIQNELGLSINPIDYITFHYFSKEFGIDQRFKSFVIMNAKKETV